MARNFYQLNDAQLAVASAQFYLLINAAPASYGVTAAQSTAYGTLNTNYQTALGLATGESTRTKVTIGNKNIAKKALKTNALFLAGIIRGTPTVTNPQLESLGLSPRLVPSPVPAPAMAPLVEVVSVSGRLVKLRLRDTAYSGRGKPPGVKSATVFSYVGATAPQDITAWKYEGVTTKVVADILFPDAVAGGSLVWFTAIWANNRAQSGPAADPVSTNVAGGGVSLMAA